MPDRPLSRADRRRHSEQRMLTAARRLFAERGYERTTIRAVAAEAEVDPALVMQRFGAKSELFRQASKITGADGAPGPGSEPGRLTELLLSTLGVKIGGMPEASLAALRSMLTHPEAREAVRATLDRQIDEIGAVVPAGDPAAARERAALVITMMLGVTLGHQLLELEALRGASPDRIVTLLRPCFEALLHPQDQSTADDGA